MAIKITSEHYQGWIRQPEQARTLERDLEDALSGTKKGIGVSVRFLRGGLSFVLSAESLSGSERLTATLKKDSRVKTSSLLVAVSAENLPATQNPLDYLKDLFNLSQVYAIASECYGSGDD